MREIQPTAPIFMLGAKRMLNGARVYIQRQKHTVGTESYLPKVCLFVVQFVVFSIVSAAFSTKLSVLKIRELFYTA